MFAHIIVSGFVQGVGYRQFTKKLAEKLGLNGWVKNIDRGRVEIGVNGSKDELQVLIQGLKRGPQIAEVKNVEVELEEKEPDFNCFEIIL